MASFSIRKGLLSAGGVGPAHSISESSKGIVTQAERGVNERSSSGQARQNLRREKSELEDLASGGIVIRI